MNFVSSKQLRSIACETEKVDVEVADDSRDTVEEAANDEIHEKRRTDSNSIQVRIQAV